MQLNLEMFQIQMESLCQPVQKPNPLEKTAPNLFQLFQSKVVVNTTSERFSIRGIQTNQLYIAIIINLSSFTYFFVQD